MCPTHIRVHKATANISNNNLISVFRVFATLQKKGMLHKFLVVVIVRMKKKTKNKEEEEEKKN